MFDWDDQELANIIWGEGREADDRIVPYTEDIEDKDLSGYGDGEKNLLIKEDLKSVNAAKNPSISKLVLDESEGDMNGGLSISGAVVDSQLDLPSFTASKTDDSGIGQKSQLDIGPQSPQNHLEDKELGDLVGNSWTSIESFDDLDRIFSNDGIDGNTSLGSTDELWSSKDLISGTAKSSSAALGSTNWEFRELRNSSVNVETNSKYLHNENPSVITGCQNADSFSPYPRRTVGKHVDHKKDAADLAEEKIGLGITMKASIDSHIASENIVSANNPSVKEKWSETQSIHEQATDRITESRLLGHVYDTWASSATNAPPFSRQCAPTTVQNYPASVSGEEQMSQDVRPIPYQHFSARYSSPYAYGDFTDQYLEMLMLKETEDEHQSVLSSSEFSPRDVITLNKPVETTTKSTKMTPQEKIEKLRRRQQMRAMLAIQRQQQRLGHQASSEDYSCSRNSCLKDRVWSMKKAELQADEILNTLPCYGLGPPNKGDDSNTISNINDYSVEDTVLYQLQDIISKLDMKIRLCIRDSLYRLAHSATQRHCVSDKSNRSGSTYDPGIVKEESSSHDRFDGNANLETETNHIDRAIAHLLFHGPLKLSVRHAVTPESSTSAKVSTEQEIAAPSSQPIDLLPKSSENECNLSSHGSQFPNDLLDSHKEDVLNDVSQEELKINPHVKHLTAEHAD